MIKPTVGRKVWYRPSMSDQSGPLPMVATQDQPLDATVIAVWGDRCVNLLVTDTIGRNFPVLSCTLVQEGDEVPERGRYAEWMPYQTAQKKVEAIQAMVFKGLSAPLDQDGGAAIHVDTAPK
ncbi:MAG: hypothetical protein ACN6OP_04425 [Pseudomonadales bacterium]|uniref:hypothetical protein n=1 Tax=Cupriavidus sp. TaxID=1873897 RepID=UPI003D13ECB7